MILLLNVYVFLNLILSNFYHKKRASSEALFLYFKKHALKLKHDLHKRYLLKQNHLQSYAVFSAGTLG